MFLILVVLYQKDCSTSNTLLGLVAQSQLLNDMNAELLLWDNSPSPLQSSQLDHLSNRLKRFSYRSTPENLPLKDIYNDTVASLRASTDQHLILLDDDTDISQAYFLEARQAIEQNREINLFLPQIYSNGVLKSPSNYYWGVGRNITSVRTGPVSAKNKMAINSGMIISMKYLVEARFRYLDTLRNYCTDNYFMLQYAKGNRQLFVLDVKINHSLSFYDSPSLSKKVAVFQEFKRALKLIHNGSLLVRAYLVVAAIKNSVKYKTVEFLRPL